MSLNLYQPVRYAERFVGIGGAAKALVLSITTLRGWEAEGKLIPEHTTGRHRRYDCCNLKPELYRSAPDARRTVAYARVSSRDQKYDLGAPGKPAILNG